jgi:putative ABC transport system permease protein
MFGATLLLAFREIRRHLLRSFLTTLGIIIGVAAVITMVTLGRGLTADVQEDIAGLGSNVFIVFPESVEGRAPPPFEDADIRAVERQIPGVVSAAGTAQAGATAFHNGQDWRTSVQGADPAFFAAQSIDVEEGRGFNAQEVESGEAVCILGTKVVGVMKESKLVRRSDGSIRVEAFARLLCHLTNGIALLHTRTRRIPPAPRPCMSPILPDSGDWLRMG